MPVKIYQKENGTCFEINSPILCKNDKSDFGISHHPNFAHLRLSETPNRTISTNLDRSILLLKITA